MELDISYADPAVDFHHGSEYIDGGPGGRSPQVDAVGGVMVDAAITFKNFVADEIPHFFLGVGTMAPEGEDNGDIRVADAGFPEFLKDGG